MNGGVGAAGCQALGVAMGLWQAWFGWAGCVGTWNGMGRRGGGAHAADNPST